MSAFIRKTRKKPLGKAKSAAIEQRTLTISLAASVVLVIGSLGYGLLIGSDLVIANGVFSLFGLFGSVLNLGTAKLVARPADNTFQYGYWHLEPLTLLANGLLLCGVCFYAVINSIETIRLGGNAVDAQEVIWFGAISGLLCGIVWLVESIVARRINSDLVRNDLREWLMDFLSSLVTMLGFLALYWLEDPIYSFWALYADSILVMLIALVILPIPIGVVIDNIREILLITKGDDPISQRVDVEMQRMQAEYPGILSHSRHVVKVGRSYFVEVSILVTQDFPLQSVAEQDDLRERLWKVSAKDAGELWLAVNITEEKRWA